MKLKLLFTSLLASFFTLAQVPINGLVKEYNFTNGSLTSGVSSTLQNGTVNLMPTGNAMTIVVDRNNEPNKAIMLNGDVFECGSTQGYDLNDFSISFWIKTNTVNTEKRYIFDQFDSGSTAGFSIYQQSGELYFTGRFNQTVSTVYNGSGPISTLSSNGVLSDNNWHHVVYQVSSSYNTSSYVGGTDYYFSYVYRVFVDNQIVSQETKNFNNSTPNGLTLERRSIYPNQNLTIAKKADNTESKYLDEIDQIRFYERTLDANEVTTLFIEDKPITPIYVDVNATGNNDGTSWADAYINLQTAINNNPFRDDIWVAQGIYTPTGSGRNSTFLIDKETKIYGGFNGTETTLEQRDFRNNPTILNGDVNGNDNSNINPSEATRSENLYHIVTVKGDPRIVTIDGFYLSGANANGTTLTSGTASAQYLHNRGGAIFLHTYLQNTEVDLNVSNCVFEKNSATDTSVFSNWYSTGVNNMYQNIYFTGCIFKNNYATQNAHVLFLGSGGYTHMTTGKIINCLLHNNTTINGPAGLYFFASTANGGNGSSMSYQILNTTISNNSGINGSVIRVDNTNNVHARNSIIWGNGSNTPITKNNAIFSCIYSNIEQGAQNGGSNTDPLLDSNYKLTSLSVAINTGINSNLPAEITTDLAGNNRFVNIDVDLGAYEYDAALSNTDFNSTKAFTIYPNPTNGDLYIQSDDEIAKVILYSLDGRVLLETQNTYLQIQELPSGVYIVSLENNIGKKSIQKIIKK